MAFLQLLRRAGEVLAGAILFVSLAALLLVGLLPHTGLYRVETVLSGSMKPYFGAGDMVVVSPEPLQDVRVGQVISYHIPVGDQHVQTHRVVKVVRAGEHPLVKTKGDANNAVDPWTARLDGTTAWRVRMVAPKLGWVVVWLRSPLVRLSTVFGIPVLLGLFGLWSIWRPERDGQAEEIADAATSS